MIAARRRTMAEMTARMRARLSARAAPRLGSPVAQRLARGGIWSLLGDAGARVLSLAAAILAARWLGVADFGSFALIQSTLGAMMMLAAFGMGQTSTRYVAASRHAEPQRLEGIIGVTLRFAAIAGLGGSVLLFLLAPWIAGSLLEAPHLEAPLRIAAPLLFLYAVSGALAGTVAGFEAFEGLARIAWLAGLASFVGVLAGVMALGLVGAIGGLLFGEVLRCLMIARLAVTVQSANGVGALGRWDRREVGIVWRFSVPILLGSLLHAPVIWICQALIARQPGGLAEIGLYDAAQKLMTLVMLVPMAASAAIGPVLANLSGSSDRSALQGTTSELAIVQLLLTAMPAALVALLAPTVLGVFGTGFSAGSRIVVVLMALAPIFVVKHLYWQRLTADGRAWAAFAVGALWAAAALALTWWWQSEGALGLAWAMLVSYGVALGASMLLTARK